MLEVKYSKKFERNFLSILIYYDNLALGLSQSFEIEIYKAAKIISNFPLLYIIRYKDYRRYNMDRFPFCIFYKISRNNVFVIDIIHQSRDPIFWP